MVLDNGKIKVAQTTLGLLFRKLTENFSETAAQDYLKYGYENYKRDGRALREALGEDYASKYEAFFLPYVDPNCLRDIEELGEGSNGIVWSAILKGEMPSEQAPSDGINDVHVVLKQPKQGLTDEKEKEAFLNEVTSFFQPQRLTYR
jgi:hypothetical protein